MPRVTTERAGAYLLLAGGMAAFGSATPVSKLVGDAFPIWLAAGARMAIALVVLVPLVVVGRQVRGRERVISELRALDGSDRLLLAGIAVVGTFGFTVLMLAGMREAPGTVAAVVMATTPAVTAFGAVVFLRDPLGWERLASVALAVAGVVVVNVAGDVQTGDGGNPLLGSVLVFGAVCCEASYSLMGKRLTANLDPLTITTAAAAGALATFLPLALWDLRRLEPGAVAGDDWTALVWWGLGTMALGSWLWFRGMQRVRAATAASFMAVMPLSALVLSYALLGESFQWVHVAGMALVLSGLVLVVRVGAPVH